MPRPRAYVLDDVRSAHPVAYVSPRKCGGATSAPGLSERLAEIDTGAPWCKILGVEYDVASDRSGGSPGLFARARSAATQGGAVGFPAAETMTGWLAGAVSWCLAGEERQALDVAFDALAAGGGAVDCVGIMPGCPERAYKVNSRSMEPAQVLPVLEKLQWRGLSARSRPSSPRMGVYSAR